MAGAYLGVGRSIVRVDVCKAGVSKKDQIPYALAECTVLHSTCDDHKIGEGRTYYQKFKFRDSALAAWRSFLAACFASKGVDISPEEINKDIGDQSVGEEQIAKGAIVVIDGVRNVTKDTKKLPPEQQKTYVTYRFKQPEEDDLRAIGL
jgi:hypothetical protein